jgi:hypothetical protein
LREWRLLLKHRHQGGMALVLLQLAAPKQVPFYMACGLAILDRQ